MAASAGARLRRTWPQRLLITFNVALIVLCVSGAGGLGYFYYRFGQLPRVDIAEGILAREEPPGEPQNFLLVGSDSRAFVEEGSDDQTSFGDQSITGDRDRADTIILVRVDPRSKRAAMVSFPRDLWVTVAGREGRNRINTAFEDGPSQLIETIKANFNIPIHHYAQVDFKGFQTLVDAIGGIDLFVASPIRDSVTGLLILDTGCVRFHGDQALAYVRSRNFQYQENGQWLTDPSGDLGRIKRQQDFIRRAIREALAKGLTNPARLNRLVNVGVDNVQISRSLDIDDIVTLGRNFRSLEPDTLQQFQLPVTPTRRGQASVVEILDRDLGEAERIFDVFRGIEPSTEDVAPTEVTVRVLNGSGRAGEAGNTSSALQQVQFSVTSPGDARGRLERTTIRYGGGQEAKAHLLERYLVNGATLEPLPGLEGVDVVLVTGADFAGVLAEPRPPDAAPPPDEAPPPTPDPDEPPPPPEC
jgi:polyisoprenyl-teichoic acid--peptidoglycan teichoic acid transferase